MTLRRHFKIPKDQRAEMRAQLIAEAPVDMPLPMVEEHVEHMLDYVEAIGNLEWRRAERDPMVRSQRRKMIFWLIAFIVAATAYAVTLNTLLSGWAYLIGTVGLIASGPILGNLLARRNIKRRKAMGTQVVGDDVV